MEERSLAFGSRKKMSKATCYEYFEDTAKKYPDKIALCLKDRNLTYSELNCQANRLAAKLRMSGIGTDICVAIMAEREIETIIGILAVWKAGGAFVAIDGKYGEDRIAYILEDCKPVLLLKGKCELPFSTELPTLSLYDPGNYVGDGENLVHNSSSEDLSYFVYTSGSTGRPKGVMQHHRGILRFFHHIDNGDILPNDCLLQFSSFLFAMSVWEMAVVFLAGATLRMIPDECILDVAAFEDYIKKYHVTVLLLPRQYIEQIRNFGEVREVITAGSEVTKELLTYLPENVDFIQLYGTSEVSGVVTEWKYDGNYQGEKLPIGRPMLNSDVFIAKDGHLCEIGEIGEIYVAGECISHGYVNKPELTAQCFVPSIIGDGLMYSTGDLGRWLPDGNIEYHGRRDYQIKIRGVRIELSEIETVLKNEKYITEATVVVRKGYDDDQVLCAFITADREMDIRELKLRLRKKLPEYMIPSYIVRLEKMPLTISRKIDRNMLPEIDFTMREGYIPPETETEKELADIFEEVFMIHPIGRNDNFFDLGGHSLKASKLIVRIAEQMGVKLKLQHIFQMSSLWELARIIDGNEEDGTSGEQIRKAEQKEYYRMTYTQRSIYFASQMDQSMAYHIFTCYRLKGDVDPEKLSGAIEQIAAKHVMLRTSFHIIDGELCQQVHDHADCSLKIYQDISFEEAVKCFRQPFDLAKVPLFRFGYVWKDDNKWLLFDIHHIIADGTSIAILLEDLSLAYNGQKLEKPELDYIDYSEWRMTKEFAGQEKFWRNTFKKPAEVLELPHDETRSRVSSLAGESVSRFLDPQIKTRMSLLLKKSGMTDYMFFLAGFMILMMQYSGEEEIVVGTPLSGRISLEEERMVGMFVNSLPMRGEVKKHKIIRDFLEEIRDFVLQAYENQEYPFEELVNHLGIKRDLSINPLFNVMLVMQNTKKECLDFEGIECIKEKSVQESAKFDLTMFIYPSDDQYELQLEYNTRLFGRESIEKYLNQYIGILETILMHPEAEIRQIPCATDTDREIILKQYNLPIRKYEEHTVLEWIEEQMQAYPENIALCDAEDRLTYASLRKEIDRMARKLLRNGVHKGDIIALVGERSIDFVIGILAVMKAGGVFVPIPSDYPKERIEYILTDCRPAVVLCDDPEEVPGKTKKILIKLMEEEKDPELREPECIGTGQAKMDDAVYMIYTSGTTGKPKGVMVKQRGLSNYIRYAKNHYITRPPVAPLFTNIGFDLTITTLFLPLCAGGTIRVYRMDVSDAVRDIFNSNKYTFVKCTPLHLKYANQIAEKPSASIETIILGGEELESSIAKEALNLFGGGIAIHNEYGPTEATVGCCDFIYHPSQDKRAVSIGKPIENVNIYVMQENTLCGIGMPGELCIAGEGVAAGYFHNPELTGQKFVPNPFGDGLMYRTGDKARWLSDGTLDYMGRMDEQVKINGYRIELGEITSCAKKLPGILDAVAVVRNTANSEKRVCLFFTAEMQMRKEDIRASLKMELPEYMIPAYIVQISQIPMTSNGKVDKNRLPEIDMIQAENYLAPENEEEKTIAGFFAALLGIEKTGADSNFFELGGHSLKAAQLLTMIEKKYHHHFRLKDIFNHPTVRELAGWIRMQGKTQEETECLQEAEEKEYYPATYVQRGIYSISTLDQSTVYNMPFAVSFDGRLEAGRVEEAVKWITRQYETARTSFLIKDGEIVQKIHKDLEADYREVTLDEISQVSQMVQPFDLSLAPLIRFRLIHLSDQDIIFIDMHHIIGDGLSIGIMMKAIEAIYSGNCPEMPEHRYRDYSEYIVRKDFEEHRQYWLRKFENGVPVVDLPTEFSRPMAQSHRGGSLCLEIDFAEKIRKLSMETGCTAYMIFLSAFLLLLRRNSQEEKIVIGTPMSGRLLKDMDHMVGMFVNSVPICQTVELNREYREFLEDVKSEILKAYTYQEYPLEKMIEDLKIEYDPSRNPLFQHMFVMQDLRLNHWKLGKFDSHRVPLENSISKFDLTVSVFEETDHFQVELEYCKDLYSEKSIECMLDHYRNLLSEIVESPEKAMGEYRLIGKKERNRILYDFNRTQIRLRAGACIHSEFEQIVEVRKNHTAIRYRDVSMTYGELNRRANQLAVWMIGNGIGKGDYVAILTERAPEMMICIFAVFKAGAAYVPMDIQGPFDRLEYMLQEVNPVMVLSKSVHERVKSHIVSLEDWEYGGLEEQNIDLTVDDQSVAYVIYTSGTTGKPKGVMVPHRGAVNLAQFHRQHYGITPEDHILQFANYVFDASVWEYLMALLNGATLYMIDEDTILLPERFEQYVFDNQISVVTLPPHYYLQIRLPFVRLVITAGSEAVNMILDHVGEETEYVNAYGPTEVTVCATDWHWNRTKNSGMRIPIGVPIDNTQVYVLQDRYLCGLFMPGEICIGGIGLAKGYLNREELTDQKFIDNPFGSGKLYRTGDIGLWNADGQLEFMGRCDEQIKLHGFRIELQEIENVIRQEEEITNAAIVLSKDRQMLCAFVTADKDINTDALKRKLREKLPEYMIPAYIRRLDLIPENSSGKVDKAYLKTLISPERESKTELKTDTERKLAEIYESVLEISNVGRMTDFFLSGGHSIKAAKILHQIEEAFGVRITLKEFFSHPVIRDLAGFLDLSDRNIVRGEIRSSHDMSYYKATGVQKSIYISSQEKSVTYNITQAVKLHGMPERQKLEAALRYLIDKYEILRTSFHVDDGLIVQKVHENVAFVLDEIVETERDAESVIIGWQKPFVLEEAPLLRALLIREPEDCILVLDVHHIVADGESVALLIRELCDMYNGATGEKANLQFKDYSQSILNRSYEKEKEYWRKILNSDLPVMNFPLDKTRSKEQSSEGEKIYRYISREDADRIKELAAGHGVTEYILLLTIYFVLLSKYTRQYDLIVQSPMNGRTQRELENMIGMFVNTLPIKVSFDKQDSFPELLEKVKESVWGAIDNQDYPFESIVGDLNIRTDGSRMPISDMIFAMQNNEQPCWNLNGIDTCENMRIDNRTSKADIVVSISEEKQGYCIEAEYCTALFERKSVEYFLEHYINLIRNVVAQPGKRLENLTILNENEKQILFTEFNHSAYDDIGEKRLYEEFERIARMKPELIACIHNHTVVTYGELNEKANRVACVLMDEGVRKDDLVAVWAEKSISTIIAIFGIWKAGAAYVPLAPDYPEERIGYILEDSSPKCMLISGETKGNLQVKQFLIEEILERGMCGENPAHSGDLSDLAYVIYTSGTTGKPKGVMLEHRGLKNLCMYCRETYGLSEKDVVLQFANFVFDASVLEIAAAFYNGAALCIADRDVITDTRMFEDYMRDKKVSWLLLPPQYYLQVNIPYVRWILTGGSEASTDVLAHTPDHIAYCNAYGPTESTVFCTDWIPNGDGEPEKIPIGKPIKNTKILVMNGNEICGIGVPGELCVGGFGVTRGYMNLDDMNHEKFFICSENGERFYRTGDLVRWKTDGNIEYLGRIDQQVKIRGYRIEISEIEVCARAIEGVQEVFIDVSSNTETQCLQMYYTAERRIGPDDIRSSLGTVLPEYMIPEYMMQVEKIPVNHSGKVARELLPKMELSRSEAEYEAPKTELELLLVNIYKEILGLENIGINDDFFSIGGNSMKAIILVNRLKKMGYKLNSKEIMRNPTIKKLIKKIH